MRRMPSPSQYRTACAPSPHPLQLPPDERTLTRSHSRILSPRGVGMNVLAVNELTGYLVELFESDPILSDVWVQGEVSNFSRPSSGHCYFTLKDSESQLR